MDFDTLSKRFAGGGVESWFDTSLGAHSGAVVLALVGLTLCFLICRFLHNRQISCGCEPIGNTQEGRWTRADGAWRETGMPSVLSGCSAALLLAQSDDWLSSAGAPGRPHACLQAGGDEHDRRGGKGNWIERRHVPNLPGEEPRPEHAANEAEPDPHQEQARAGSHDHSSDGARIGAKRDPHANLPRLLRHGVRHHAVDANDRQRQPERGEDRQQDHVESGTGVDEIVEERLDRLTSVTGWSRSTA